MVPTTTALGPRRSRTTHNIYFTGGVTTSHPFAFRSFARYARRFALTPRSLSPTRDDDLCGHQNFTAPSSTLLPDPLIDFHTAANFSSWARFLASAARFLSLLVYLPASHRVASMASRDFSRTRTARDKSPGSAAPRGRSGRSPPGHAGAGVRASFSRAPSLRNNSAARTCVEINQ